MISLDEAISILKRKFPNKKPTGNPADYNGAYAFSLVPLDHPSDAPNWDSTIFTVDKKTGEVSNFSAFDKPDFFTGATPIKKEL